MKSIVNMCEINMSLCYSWCIIRFWGRLECYRCEIRASNGLQWQKTCFCILHRGDDCHLHDGNPPTCLKRTTPISWMIGRSSGSLEGWQTRWVMTNEMEEWRDGLHPHDDRHGSRTDCPGPSGQLLTRWFIFSMLFLNSIIIWCCFMVVDVLGMN